MNSDSPEPFNDIPSQAESSLTMIGSVWRGSLGFAVVSMAGFSVWAFGGRWLHAVAGEAGLYVACLLVFLGVSGLMMHRLVNGPNSLLRFYKIFIPAFFGYAIAWCAAWFIGHFGWGEWLGSLAGSLVFTAMVGRGFKNYHHFVRARMALFCCHSAGYFLGGAWMHWSWGAGAAMLFAGCSKGQIALIAELGWGLIYGLGFGVGIGYVFYNFQCAEVCSDKSTCPET